jgi:hypothetical protein
MPPPGYIPPMPYAGICPRCKIDHGGSKYTFRDGPIGLGPNGGWVDRVWGYFCENCEKTPFWRD